MLKKLNRAVAGLPQNRPVKVLQFGGGNFLRGFADWIIDVLNERTGFNGAIDIVTSVTPGTAEQINQQDGLYHLVQQGHQNGNMVTDVRCITSVNRAINPAQDFDAFISTALNQDLRFILSNTTESGIVFDKADASVLSLPNSFPGKLTLLLYRRFLHFNGALDKSLIIIPCELIDQNGEQLKNIVLQYASHWNLSPEFAAWVNQNIFCNTLVDRIVPGFPKETIDQIQTRTGFEDNITVAAEPFYFWAIEAPPAVQREFPTQLAGLNNVVFADDISPYRIRKVRILNGAHTAMMPVAYLRGIRTVKETMDDPSMEKFVRDLLEEEIVPTLPLPKQEVAEFANAVLDRFRNPFIKHLLISISLNSIAKFKVRIIPTIIEYVRLKHALPEKLMISFAAMICFYRGTWKNEVIPLSDSANVISFMNEAWKENTIEKTVHRILSNISLWEQDLSKIEGLSQAVTSNIISLLDSEGR
jgi:tagaturonate reductase